MSRRLLRLLCWAALIYALTFFGVVLQTATFRNTPFDAVARTDAIVCLGAGMSPDGTLHRDSRARVETCVALYEDGAAPMVHFTGGRAVAGGPSAGAQMAAFAATLGLPSEAVSVEEASLSTLQNALFSQPMLANAGSLRLVTEGFHLPRAYASFALMGSQDITLTMSEPVRLRPDGGWNWRVLLRESLAIWFNAARYIIWLLAGVTGVEGRDALLA